MNNKVVWLVLIGAVLLLYKPKKKASSLSGLRRRKRKAMLGGLGNMGYKIYSKNVPISQKYGISSESYSFPAHKVTLDKFPEKTLSVYHAKSGWIVMDHDIKATLGKERAGWGWRGFSTKEEAVDNYMSKIIERKPTWENTEKKIAEKGGQMTLFGGLGNIGYRELNKITPYKWHENSKGEDEAIIDGVKISSSTYGDNALFDVYVNGKAKTAIVQPTKTSINSAIKRLVGYAKENTKKGQMALFGLGRIDNCYKYLTMKGFGPTEACFSGESTYGKGTATFTATDTTGRKIPSMVSTKIMPFDKFYNLMEKNKAKMVS